MVAKMPIRVHRLLHARPKLHELHIDDIAARTDDSQFVSGGASGDSSPQHRAKQL